MSFKNLTIDDKEIIDSYTKNKFNVCDYNFTNQFLWSHGEKAQYRISEDGDVLSIRSTYIDTPYYYCPVSKTDNIENIKNELKKIFSEEKILVTLVPENIALQLTDQFICEEKRDSFDYVYEYEDLATLKGRKYAKKKNRISHFLKAYPNYTYESLTDNNIADVIKFQDEWEKNNNTADILDVLKNENIGIHELLKNFHKLDFKGGMLKVDNKIISYTLGEAITDEYVVIHIEKAIGDYVGSYQMINKVFLDEEFKGYKYVNREDDFGDDGLREAKESYHPIFMLKKYDISGIK